MKSKRNRCVLYFGLVIFFVASFVLPFFGSVLDIYATGVTDEINVTIPASCSLTSVVGTAHTSTIENSTYVDDIGETTFKVFCNDAEGFSVYAVGYTDDSFGNNTLNPTNLASSYAIATGTATSGDTSNWAMKLTAVTGTYAPTIHSTEENSNTYSFTSYHTIPSKYTKVASYSSNTDATTGSSFKSTYAVYASPTQPADSYTGKVKYTVMHPASEAAPVEISQLTYMQDFKDLTPGQRATVLNSMEYNTTYSLMDNRDNKTYQIARLKDDNIWMAENLDLGRTSLTQDLTSSNTNFFDTNVSVSASTFNSWIKSSGTSSLTSAELIPINGNDTISSAPYGTLYNYCAASAGSICTSSNDFNATSDLCPSGWRLPTGGSSGEFQALYNLIDNTRMRTSIADGGAAFARAGQFYASTPISQGINGIYWSSLRYSSLNMYYLSLNIDSNQYGSRSGGYSIRCIVKKASYPLTVSYSTGVSSVQINNVVVQDDEMVELEEGFPYSIIMTPSTGYGFAFWSSESGAFDSIESQATAYTAGNNSASLIASASYVSTEMQNLPSDNCNNAISYVRDNRDGHVYPIQRLVDGKCWMMENLDLGRTELTTNLTSSNTNITDTVAATTFNSWKKTFGTSSFDNCEFIPVDGGDTTAGSLFGVLYNYCAASAGSVFGNANSSYKNDICPAGWRLPTGGSSGDFKSLNDALGAKMRLSAVDGGAAFALAGKFNSSTPVNHGSSGHYWSSSPINYSSNYILSVDEYGFGASWNMCSNRDVGYSVRCVLKSN